jgi:hypothetical protein
MQALSRELNPECEHVIGDMRTAAARAHVRRGDGARRGGVHDEQEALLDVARTAYIHTRPGGTAV